MRMTPLAPVAVLLVLTACGGQDPDPVAAAPDPAVGAADAPAAPGTSLEDAMEDMSPESKLDVLGTAVESVLDGVDGYSVDGSTITFDLGTQQNDELSSDCTIISTAAGAVDPPSDARIVLSYANADVECDL